MKHKNYNQMNTLEVAAFICNELKKVGIETTLSGGFCAEVYSHGLYTSADIDLINRYNEDHKAISDKMIELGFEKEGRYFFRDDIEYGIEFPSGPPALGHEFVTKVAEIETCVGVLRILTPTDCVKDRLCGYYVWEEKRSLEQALMVAARMKDHIDMKNIKKWSIAERSLDKFNEFEKRLKKTTIKHAMDSNMEDIGDIIKNTPGAKLKL